MTWTVYCHIHVPTGRAYVGLTSGSMEERWSQHVSRSRRHSGRSRFQREIGRLGPGSFSHVVLADGLTEAQARDVEARQIVLLRAESDGFNTRREPVRLDGLL